MQGKQGKDPAAQALGKKGGLSTKKKYGPDYYKKLSALGNKAQGKKS